MIPIIEVPPPQEYEFRVGYLQEQGVIYSEPTPCTAGTVDYLVTSPRYKRIWYEVRGGALGPEWVRVDQIVEVGPDVPQIS